MMKPRSDAFLRKNLEEEIALVDDAGDVYGGQSIGLVDIDVVLFVRRRSRSRARSPGPTRASAREIGRTNCFRVQCPCSSDEPEPRHEQQSKNERSWSHVASLLRSSIYNFSLTQCFFFCAAGIDRVIGELLFLLHWHLAFQTRQDPGLGSTRPVHRAYDLLFARHNSPLLFYRPLCTRPIR